MNKIFLCQSDEDSGNSYDNDSDNDSGWDSSTDGAEGDDNDGMPEGYDADIDNDDD